MPYKLRTLTEATAAAPGLLSAADKQLLDALRQVVEQGGGGANVVTFTADQPLPLLETYGSESFDPLLFFPFAGEEAEWEVRGVALQTGSTVYPSIRGTFSYTPNEYSGAHLVLAKLEVWGSASMPFHMCRTRFGYAAQASDGTWSVTWSFPWIQPEEK